MDKPHKRHVSPGLTVRNIVVGAAGRVPDRTKARATSSRRMSGSLSFRADIAARIEIAHGEVKSRM
jgi:hypothetical protein